MNDADERVKRWLCNYAHTVSCVEDPLKPGRYVAFAETIDEPRRVWRAEDNNPTQAIRLACRAALDALACVDHSEVEA